MKINNYYRNNAIQQQNPSLNKPSFRGYFACPIDELHIQAFNEGEIFYPIIEELHRKCGQYFKTLVQTFDGVIDACKFKPTKRDLVERNNYGQDNKIFTKRGMLLLEGCTYNGWEEAETLAQHLNLPTRSVSLYVEGGNCFFGKKSNGDTFALVGEDALRKNRYGYNSSKVEKTDIDKSKLASELGLNPDNIYILPQPDYHLDMAIRPLKYPYVLVDDVDTTIKLVGTEKQKAYLSSISVEQKEHLKEKGYTSPEITAQNLKDLGFKPILVPGSLGIYRTSANYMNAIVHQKPDGKLVYITNSTKNRLGSNSNVEEIFSQYLKEQCPYIDEVIFIDGEGTIGYILGKVRAGIHCLTSERPDFKKWETMETHKI